MGGFPAPTYALVGERTMAKPTFPNAFSWKCGFLVNKLQRINNRNVHKNELPKDPTNVASCVATFAADKSHRKTPTSHAVAMTASATSAATDPALLPASTGSEATFQTTPVRSKTENISAKPLSSKTKASIPYTTAGFDEGDLHCALPIQGLPPEDTLHSKNAKEVRHTQFIKNNSNSATTPQTNGQSQASQDSQTDPRGRTDEGNKRSGYGLRDDLLTRNPQRRCRGQTPGTKTLRPISLDRAHKVSFKDARHPTRRQKRSWSIYLSTDRAHETQRSQQHNHSRQRHQSRTAIAEDIMNQGLKTSLPLRQIDSSDSWGHQLDRKRPNTIRLLLQNIGGIDGKPKGSVKLAALREFMEANNVDIAALTECNVAWDKTDPDIWPPEQTKFWWENAHWSLTHNRKDPHAGPYQPGGTGILVVNQLSYRAQCPGDDSVGLGRWCWAWLRGKHNQFLRVVSVYRLCISSGPLSTYQQQIRFWGSKHFDGCPRQKLLDDLQTEILKWQEDGDYIVLLADMNEDVISDNLMIFFKGLQLVEAISSLHGHSPIPTHQKGSKAIDGSYVSPALLEQAKGGILPLGSVTCSDHRSVWLDLQAYLIAMYQQDPVT